jgi:hypothetical protein
VKLYDKLLCVSPATGGKIGKIMNSIIPLPCHRGEVKRGLLNG